MQTWEELLTRQHGVVTRQQAMAYGISPASLHAHLRSGRWRRLTWRVYATFTGTLPRQAWLWAVMLYAGPGAALSHETAAELAGLIDRPAPVVHVSVPAHRRVVPIDGVRVHVSRRLDQARHPSRLPPQTRVEETVLDLVDRSRTAAEAIDWVMLACARRLTTPDRLRTALAGRRRSRWRDPLREVLQDVAEGCHSLLELRYLRDVERRHRLPRGTRQAVRRRRGGRWYDDVHYAGYRTRVELDGRVAHPDEARFRDLRRDNEAVAAGDSVLRYGWVDVTGDPCGCAAQMVRVLRAHGWQGIPQACRPGCPVSGL